MSWEAWGDPPEPLPARECQDCDGTGEAGDILCKRRCPHCDGTGEIVVEYEPFEDDVI